MSVLPRAAIHNSTIMQTVTSVRTRIRTAASNARVLTMLDRFRTTDDTGPAAGSSPAASTTDTESPPTQQPTAKDTTTPTSQSARSMESSVAYRLLQRGQAIVTTAWLYNWLTAEPEPEVIVIDLRETQTVGMVLTTLDRIFSRAERDLLPALPTATVTRSGYWLRSRVLDRPLRVASIGLAIVVNLGLLSILTGSEDPITPITLFLLAALLLAARGFQSTMSLDELTNTTWYQRTTTVLIAAFEPPDPPESAATDQDSEASAETDTPSDTPESN